MSGEDSPHEVEFTAEAASWINAILAHHPDWPFEKAVCEGRSRNSARRRDLSLVGRDGRILVTGEVKLPYQKDGASPHNASVVADARGKAIRANAAYFFTWNVNECVLWETETPIENPGAPQFYRTWKIVTVSKPVHLELMQTINDIKYWLVEFLDFLSKLLQGRREVGSKAPDERFVDSLESALALPIRLTIDELTRRHGGAGGGELDRWMRDDQGWTLTTSGEGTRDNLERAAQFSCYALVNRLVFYEALMKRYGGRLTKMAVPAHIDRGEDLQAVLESYFAEARTATGDYETVFGEDRLNIGNRIPFYADAAVSYWVELIEQIHEFDFSRLDYEVIGSIFERLISPHERHKYGQFYTRVEIVDLINSFCIREGTESVIDPACGGGTFLVRAYARKRALAPGRPHEIMLGELFGADISNFAAHLTTINLATRDLVEAANYPRIARADFFDVSVDDTFMRLPSRARSQGLGRVQQRTVTIPMLDGVIGNPPYVRQEDIRADKSKGKDGPRRGTKEFYRALALKDARAKLSGRSDLHCYFWPHAFTFLKPEGWLCFLTSSQWLDVEYGFRLQEWILERFKIVAIFESIDEPWFVGARVVTAATILQRCDDPAERASNVVRFVQLRQPIGDILAHDGTLAGSIHAANFFRDEIMGLTENIATSRYRVRLVSQGALLDDGIELTRLMEGSAADEETADDKQQAPDTYYGGKWGIHLRAPDLWFDLLDRFGDRFARLGELADIRFGVKSGKDEFFFPRDVSRACLDRFEECDAFRREYGVTRGEVESGLIRLVACGEKYGEIKPIEARFLEPEIHSLMEVKGYTVSASDCRRLILVVGQTPAELQGTYVLQYIRWGELNGWHQGATCAARVSKDRCWFDLSGHHSAIVLWPKERQYRHVAPSNPENLLANCRLYEIYPRQDVDDSDLWGGLLNCSWTFLSSLQFGRPVGNEGNWSTMVVDTNLMLVPDVREAREKYRALVRASFQILKQRPALQFLSARRMREMAYGKGNREHDLDALSDRCELDMPDRRALDDAVLQMLGVASKRDRTQLIDDLYDYLRQFFEAVRRKEEKAIVNKNRSKRKIANTPSEIAQQILGELKENHGRFVRSYHQFLGGDHAFTAYEIPAVGQPEVFEDMFMPHGGVRFVRGRKVVAVVNPRTHEQAEFIAAVWATGVRGLTRVPIDRHACREIIVKWEQFVNDRNVLISKLISDRTSDPDLQERITSLVQDSLMEHF